MTKKQSTRKSTIPTWYVQQLRLTAFPSPASDIIHTNWWTDITGVDLETSVTNRKTGEQIDQGLLNDARFILNVQPSRIDWIYGIELAVATPDNVSDITLGKYADVAAPFKQLMTKWFALDTCPTLIRIAFGAVLLQPAESHDDAYQKLKVNFQSEIKLDGARDFLYRINRPRVSQIGIPDFRINRLSTWSAIAFQQTLFPILTLPHSIHSSPEFYATRLELDINTDAEYQGDLENHWLPQLFAEVMDLGEEIANEGDIP
jgi:hypothetical protein